jgi:hypothetical protein
MLKLSLPFLCQTSHQVSTLRYTLKEQLLTEKVGLAVVLWTRLREVHVSNLGQDID